MILAAVKKTDGRTVNEDTIASARKKGITCIVIADGLGGEKGGEIASELARDTVINEFNSDAGFSQEHIRKYIMNANEAIANRAKTDPELLHMSSTVTVLLIKGRNAIWANVGDSRMYRLYDGAISEVSEDHSLAFIDFVNSAIEYDMIRTSPNRSKLTSALGVSFDGVNISNKIAVNNATSFVLCTDGFWEYVTEEDIENTFKSAKTASEWLKAMVDIRDSNAQENSDNYSAVVVAL